MRVASSIFSPFVNSPYFIFSINGKVKGYLSVEMVTIPQVAEDVFLAAHGTTPVYAMPTGREIAKSEQIIAYVKEILAGTKEEY